jgi:GTP-binding protein
MAGPLPLRFVQSASDVDQLPDAVVEVALVGRSNVGKSSLLNALAHRNNLAKTSKTPGATRLINIFELTTGEPGRWLIDLPGYGYAKVSHTERNRWAAMIQRYLDERDTLDTILWLIDGEIGPTKLDLQTWEWLVDLGRPIRVVATKLDKVSSTRRPKRKADLAGALGLEKGDVRWVSAAKGIGLDELRADILDLLRVDG